MELGASTSTTPGSQPTESICPRSGNPTPLLARMTAGFAVGQIAGPLLVPDAQLAGDVGGGEHGAHAGCGERQLGPATKTKEPNIILVSDNGGILQAHSCCILGRI